jgi:putative ABC transport system substrate-binding protein
MKRRTAIGTGGLLLAAAAAFAQPVRKVHRIGVAVAGLGTEAVGPQPVSLSAKALLRGLSELGYKYGQDYVTEARGAEGKPARYPVIAAELAALGVDVIVGGGPNLVALKEATSSIPVVMSAAIDPVADGLVQSLRRSGTNFTGLSHQFADLAGKCLESLKEVAPGAAPVAVLWDRASRSTWNAAQAAAKVRGWQLLSLELKDAGDLEAAFKAATDAHARSLLVLTGQIAFPNRQRIAEHAMQNHLPSMFDMRPYVDAGGLISYGADLVDIWRQSARFVDKILKGARPADLPVEQPNLIEMVINLNTAKALGITIPQKVLLRANDLIR